MDPGALSGVFWSASGTLAFRFPETVVKRLIHDQRILRDLRASPIVLGRNVAIFRLFGNYPIFFR
jgi:hypothetical protein